ncbi:hypothetical protein ACYPKM_00565 [Pseudomonas aeruginosa]
MRHSEEIIDLVEVNGVFVPVGIQKQNHNPFRAQHDEQERQFRKTLKQQLALGVTQLVIMALVIEEAPWWLLGLLFALVIVQIVYVNRVIARYNQWRGISQAKPPATKKNKRDGSPWSNA